MSDEEYEEYEEEEYYEEEEEEEYYQEVAECVAEAVQEYVEEEIVEEEQEPYDEQDEEEEEEEEEELSNEGEEFLRDRPYVEEYDFGQDENDGEYIGEESVVKWEDDDDDDDEEEEEEEEEDCEEYESEYEEEPCWEEEDDEEEEEVEEDIDSDGPGRERPKPRRRKENKKPTRPNGTNGAAIKPSRPSINVPTSSPSKKTPKHSDSHGSIGSALAQGDDEEFLDSILKNKHGNIYGSGTWNALFQGNIFTNAGRLGHSRLPEATFDKSGNFFVHTMYVKDFVGSSSTKGKSFNFTTVVGKVARTSASQKARNFYTQPVSLDTLFKNCRAVIHGKRFYIHQSTGVMDAKEALRQTVNNDESFELALPRSLVKELADFLRILNRTKGYGCCELGTIGNGWFTARNIEMLGPEDTRFTESAAIKSKSKSKILGFGKKKGHSDTEECRKKGSLRYGFMFEEYTSEFGAIDGDFQITVDRPVKWPTNLEFVPSGAEYIDLECEKQVFTITSYGDITYEAGQNTRIQLLRPFHQYSQILEDGKLSLKEGVKASSPLDAVLAYLGARHNNLSHVSNSAVSLDSHTLDLVSRVIVPLGERKDACLGLDATITSKDPPVLSQDDKNFYNSFVPVMCLSGYLYDLLTLQEHSRVGYSPSEDYSFVYPKPTSSIKRGPPSPKEANSPVRRAEPTRPGTGTPPSNKGRNSVKSRKNKPRRRPNYTSLSSAVSVNSSLTIDSGGSSTKSGLDSSIRSKTTTVKADGTTVEIIEYNDGTRATTTITGPTNSMTIEEEESELTSQERSVHSRRRSTEEGASQHSNGTRSKKSTKKATKKAPAKRAKSVNLQDPKFKIEEDKRIVVISNNGRDGNDASHGAAGNSGNKPGEDGTPGMGASRPSQGGDAGNIVIVLSTNESDSSAAIVSASFSDSASKSLRRASSPFPLANFPNVSFSATGGRGGNGGNGGAGGAGKAGRNGRDATPHAVGEDGQNGGKGGPGGKGSSGADGGDGGNVRIEVTKSDAFLLMALEAFSSGQTGKSVKYTVSGIGGKAGSHGSGGEGARGGNGGNSCTYSPAKSKGPFRRQTSLQSEGGSPGRRGKNGDQPKDSLTKGQEGTNGSLTILVDGKDYEELFVLRLAGLNVTGPQTIGDLVFELGSTVRIEEMLTENIGSMPLPAGCNVRVGVKEPMDSLLALQNGHQEQKCAVDTSFDVHKTQKAKVKGVIHLKTYHPGSVRSSDYDPVVRNVSFKLAALMSDPDNNFSRPFAGFDTTTKKFQLRFPVENTSGIDGLISLSPHEPMTFSFQFANVSKTDLGSQSDCGRQVKLRYLVGDVNGVVNQGGVQFATSTSSDMADIGKDGRTVDVPIVKANSSVTIDNYIQFTDLVEPFSSVAIQVEILLQDLKGEDSAEEQLICSPIQRRRLVVSCEPEYSPSVDSDVVIIGALSMSHSVHTRLTSVLEEMGLKHETYSVSRYGSLEPDFQVEDGTSLREAFRNKLLVVINKKFQKNRFAKEWLFPLTMLPPGALLDSRLFDPSTRWLLIGNQGPQPAEDLLHAHTYGWNEVKNVASENTFQKLIQSKVNNEVSKGKVDTFTRPELFRIGRAKQARTISDFLVKVDGVRQYSAVHNSANSSVDVYLNYCRSRNPGVSIPDFDAISSNEVMLAIAEAMHPTTRTLKYCENLRRPGVSKSCLRAYRFASVGELTREVSYLLDGSVELNDRDEDCFPTLGQFTDNIDFLVLLRDCQENAGLKQRASDDLSDLVGRFEAVAMSKDLRPRNPIARKGTKSMQDSLTEAVHRIRRQWRLVMTPAKISDTMQQVKRDVKSGLDAEYVNLRADGTWMNGLAFIHSTHKAGVASRRINELGQGLKLDKAHSFKIPKPASMVVSSVAVMRQERTLRAQTYTRHVKAGEYIRSERDRLSGTSHELL